MAAANATTHFLFKGTAPFLLSCRRRRLLYHFPNTASVPVPGGRLIKSYHCSISGYPHAIFCNNNTSHSTSTPSRRRERMHLLCYCTEVAAQDNNVAAAPSTAAAATVDVEDDNSIREAANTLDIRVGRILKAWRHEEADSLYVEEVDVGEPEPRTICSGLVKYIPLHLIQDRNVIVLANLKPRNMRGVKSFGMLMAASDATHENVELLVPPEGAVPGERVWFGSVDEKENLPDVASPNQVQKKKIWELVQPRLKTDDSGVAKLGIHHMRTSGGVVICEALKNANIS
ncbi:Tyrosine--tRNA ligase, cytoplasmic [Sesamum alatum]|uniref:Tyrosine--tRNA ligase, cytoplasmic n=1 Tax=Sesamum alatum TaxID=300844 RepID=A0AAE1YUE6_9LAMI|nr:Tyrosine--tRNA ligase, cytoplasmic [Sesamum alatum]